MPVAMLGLLVVTACDVENRAGPLPMRGAATGAATAQLPDLGALSRIPVGPLAGVATSRPRLAITNPYTGDANAVHEGEFLFVHMNCAYCHGFDGGGGMGPNLGDDYWRFGGDDADVFNSVFAGRGKGMPAWGAALTEDQIWKVVAYVRTLGAGEPGRGGDAAGAEGKSGTGRMNSGAQTPRQFREPLKSMNENEP